MKRFLALSLSLVMLLTVLPLAAFAESRDSKCYCENPSVREWFYYASGGDCTDPAQVITRYGYCQNAGCYGIYEETVPTQQSHKLYDLPMYDDDGKPVLNSDGEPNYLAPTCSDKGYIKKQCSTCGKIVKVSINETGHKFGEWQAYIKCFSVDDPRDENNAVTAATLGLSRRYCLNGCGAYEEERSEGHSVYYIEGKAANCFSEGSTDYKYCTTCGTESPSTPIEKLEHIDKDGNGYCDLCVSQYREGEDVFCSCLCHSENSFVQLLMPLLRLIWQLLGIDNCHGDCNAVHYE